MIELRWRKASKQLESYAVQMADGQMRVLQTRGLVKVDTPALGERLEPVGKWQDVAVE